MRCVRDLCVLDYNVPTRINEGKAIRDTNYSELIITRYGKVVVCSNERNVQVSGHAAGTPEQVKLRD